jgi:hypothetical protein
VKKEQYIKHARPLFQSEAGRAILKSLLINTEEGHLVLGYDPRSKGPKIKAVEGKIVAPLIPTRGNPAPEMTRAFIDLVNFSQQHDVNVLARPSIASSVVHWIRNDLLASLYGSGQEFDYVLFMDDDIVPTPDALVKLVAHNVDIVAAGCTVRQDPPLPNFRSYEPETFSFRTAFEWSGEGRIQIGGVGTGMMLISRQALEVIGEYYLSCQHERKYFGMSLEVMERMSQARREQEKKSRNSWWFEFLKHPLGLGEYGEDISFCFKARECGIPVHVDTTVRPKHMGTYGFSLEDYFPYQADLLEQERQAKETTARGITNELESALVGVE